MGKINCIILRRNRTVTRRAISSTADSFTFLSGLYSMDKSAVNLRSHSEQVKSEAELIFVENDPDPVKSEGDDNSGSILDVVVIENALKALGKPKSQMFSIIADYLREPTKLIPLVFALIILISFLLNLGSIV